MPAPFEQKTVVVTGAGSGIGYVTALKFADQGAHVIGVDVNREGLQRWAADMAASNASGSFLECDISSEQNVQRMVAAVLEKRRKIDVLVHMAAIFLIRGTASASAEDWSRVLGNNLTGAALCSRFVADHMRQSGGGAIVITSSIAGMRAEKGFATYSCSKAALLMLVQSMAVEFGACNIRVNAVSPGPVDSPILRKLTHDSKTDWNQWSTAICKNQCLPQRMIQPADVAESVLFLASDKARMITGTNLVVDGGYSIK